MLREIGRNVILLHRVFDVLFRTRLAISVSVMYFDSSAMRIA